MSIKRKTRRNRKPVRKKKIDFDIKELDALLERAKSGALQDKDIELIKSMAECIVFLSRAVDERAATVKKLLRMVFGATTEKKENIINKPKEGDAGENNNQDSDTAAPDKENGKPEPKKRKGNGQNGADVYTGADRVGVQHPDLKPGDHCPECKEGKLYKNSEPGIEIRVKGAAPLQATVYIREKLRCNLCGKIFTAPMPKNAGNKKYNASAIAMIALLKYGSGLPFNRLEGLQASLGVPLASSTQWDIINAPFQMIQPVYEQLIWMAAQGEVFHNDDTNMKIQTLIEQNKSESPVRKGMFTTGIVSIFNGRKIVLFFTGRSHAGENLDALLYQRDDGLPTPLQMCDALSSNTPKEFATILIYCLIHARRNFVNVAVNFPEECEFVINILADVYRFDAQAKEQNMTPEERLQHHQENSAPLMKKLEIWLDEQIEQKKVEPNSSLGGAILYMQNHWPELTAFLRIPNAPLDNNICERALKKAILHRKNSLFYKTEHGAAVGDMYMSLFYNCQLAGANSFDYLKELIDHPDHVRNTPSEWLPWNYKATLNRLQNEAQTLSS